MGRTKPMPRKFTRVNEVEKNGQRSTVLYSVAGAVRVCGGPALRCSVSADVALSEKSPHLGSAWVRWSLQQEPGMQPDEPPSPILLLGRDRSPSGPALRCSMSADVALSEKSPHLGGAWVRWFFWRTLCCGRMSFRGRDRSPSGPAPQTWALSETSPYHGSARGTLSQRWPWMDAPGDPPNRTWERGVRVKSWSVNFRV